MTPPLKAYEELIAAGTITSDPAQAAAAQALETLNRALKRYKPGRKNGGLFRKDVPIPNGLYLWGGVGAGKSLLMDLFFETAPVAAKRRIHFHSFMQETHHFIAQWRGMDDTARRQHPSRARSEDLDDPIPHAAKAVFDRAALLCFDEFQVTDITDAMLLGRLFEALFVRGAVVVATSNRHPDDLYKDGLNRELFVPFIQLLKTKLDVHELVSAKDYRLDRLQNDNVYFSPLGDSADTAMNAAWASLTAGASATSQTLKVGSRKLLIPCAARGVARGTFNHWCAQAFGPGDYLQLAAAYPTLFVDHIPILGPENRNEAKRFVTLIDALYEARCTLICSAAAPAEQLYPTGDGSFEFARTVSRLSEMQSNDYLQLPHQGTVPASQE
ncbi:MAG: cell division protein ZapE [Pseudomonadota bacterium]